MSKEEILEGNKLIAEFLGYELEETVSNIMVYAIPRVNGNMEFYEPNELLYNSSWDWLMPVVEKIESLGYKWEIGTSSTLPYHYCRIWSMEDIDAISPLDAIYGAVIEFIKWHNQNKLNE